MEVAADAAHEADLRRRAEALVARGYQVQELSASEARRLEPALTLPEGPRAIFHFPEEGYIHPLLYVAETLTQLRAAGVKLVEQAPVVGFDSSAQGVRVRTGGRGQLPGRSCSGCCWTLQLSGSAVGWRPGTAGCLYRAR